jgi:NAD(P)-dependent dehydrogenase (short-subunit alcohol dehydrogenase family)
MLSNMTQTRDIQAALEISDATHALANALRAAGTEAIAIPCDVAEPRSVEFAIQRTLAEFGRLDLAVNNAGISGALTDIAHDPLETWNRVIAVPSTTRRELTEVRVLDPYFHK